MLSLHLPKGIYSNFAPHSESDTDYFIMGVYLTASLGLYGSCLDPSWYNEAEAWEMSL